MGKASGIKGKRVTGGSSPHKKNLYENHFPITVNHKNRNLNRKCKELNKLAEKRKYNYSYKIQERKCDSGKCKCMVKVKNR